MLSSNRSAHNPGTEGGKSGRRVGTRGCEFNKCQGETKKVELPLLKDSDCAPWYSALNFVCVYRPRLRSSERSSRSVSKGIGMEKRVGEMIVLSVLLILSGSAQAATTDCSSALTSLATCLPYVIGSVSSPSQDCCSALPGVIKATPVCLCQLLGYGSDPSTTVPSSFNQTLATQLPTLCNVSANEDRCPALVAGTPIEAPGASGPAPPPSAGGPGGPPSSAASLLSSLTIVLGCVAVAFFASPLL